MNTKIFSSILIVGVLIAGAIMFSGGGNSTTPVANGNNISVVDGKQIINITARGGYSPLKSIAKAGLPTILRFTTNGTFDCSSYVRIPSLNIGQSLASSGTTDLDLGSPKEGILHGTCGMGMYPFDIDFQS